MKQLIQTSLFLLVITMGFSACREEPERVVTSPTKDFNDLKKYFPFSGKYVWHYDVTTADFIKNTKDSFQVERRFNVELGYFENYKDGRVYSTMHWNNSGTKLGCCTDRVLLDYSLIDCTGDSTIIFAGSNNPVMTIFQICEKQLVPAVPQFDTVKCVKTFQINNWTDGSRIFIERYFGHDVGIVYSLQHIIDSTGQIIHTQTEKLRSIQK
ncbi:MAG: hypothetical protein H6608_05745 [Flavobacteriales bacterium]|nr:hypothetical protein [Bacteroidota bacterium]MCB9240610.1 hypothetical protein [Flavobacteriales bacterium]